MSRPDFTDSPWIRADGSVKLTDDWDAGSFKITALELSTDTISDQTGVGVTVDGMLIKDSKIHIGDNREIFFGDGDDGFIRWISLSGLLVLGLTPNPILQFKGSSPKSLFTGDVLISQPDASGAVSVLTMWQQDTGYAIVKYIGRSAVGDADRSLVKDANFSTPGALAGWVKVEIEDNRGAGIVDGNYWQPFYAIPT